MAIELVSLPVFGLFLRRALGRDNCRALLGILLLGTWALTVIGTFFSALTVNLRIRELMLPTLVYPLMIPALMSAMTLTTTLLAGEPHRERSDVVLENAGGLRYRVLAAVHRVRRYCAGGVMTFMRNANHRGCWRRSRRGDAGVESAHDSAGTAG